MTTEYTLRSVDGNWVNPNGGRRKIKTHWNLEGKASEILPNVKKMLNDTLPIHNLNVVEIDALFSIFFNHQKIETEKVKEQRPSINNKDSVADAYKAVRTINSYCFGEPLLYIANDMGKQANVEILNKLLKYRNNHKETVNATLNSSICGIGYKTCLPTQKGLAPFKVSGEIRPQDAYIVYSDDIVSEKVAGVYISKNYNDKGEEDGKLYTVWTNDYQFILKEGEGEGGERFKVVQQKLLNEMVDAYPLINGMIPLIEIPRNSFRLGDFEMAITLFDIKNKVMNNRLDDIQQIVDYLLVLINCEFENDKDKQDVLKSRLLTLKVVDPNNKPSVDILKNALDQSGIQQFAEYIDTLIQEILGIPSRQERGGGGGDTGQAVKYRNGFRDLESNASNIVPQLESAELEFIELCLTYCTNREKLKLGDISTMDINIKFRRTLNDDVVSTSQAFSTFVNAGMSPIDALTASKAVLDPDEVSKRCVRIVQDISVAKESEPKKNGTQE